MVFSSNSSSWSHYVEVPWDDFNFFRKFAEIFANTSAQQCMIHRGTGALRCMYDTPWNGNSAVYLTPGIALMRFFKFLHCKIHRRMAIKRCMIHHGMVTPWCILHHGMATLQCILHGRGNGKIFLLNFVLLVQFFKRFKIRIVHIF